MKLQKTRFFLWEWTNFKNNRDRVSPTTFFETLFHSFSVPLFHWLIFFEFSLFFVIIIMTKFPQFTTVHFPFFSFPLFVFLLFERYLLWESLPFFFVSLSPCMPIPIYQLIGNSATDYINIPIEVTVKADSHYEAGYSVFEPSSRFLNSY